MNKPSKNKKGLTIIEVMAAMFILTIGITGVLALINNSVRESNDSRDSLIASELAQEGLEITRNIRDNNFLSNPGDHFSGLSNGDCRVSYASSACNSGGYALNYSGGYYTHNAGSATKFSRKIIISTDAASGGKNIASMVVWGRTDFPAIASCSLKTTCVYAQEILTDWQ